MITNWIEPVNNIVLYNFFFRQKCERICKHSTSFAEYITLLKLFDSAGVECYDMFEPVYTTFFKFGVEKPELFKKNLHELYEVYSLHQKTFGTAFWMDQNVTW